MQVLESETVAPATTPMTGTLDPAADVVRYYHTDVVGSVRVITDAAAQVIQRFDYKPFGDEWLVANAETRRFTGQERDAETQLDYFGARHYLGSAGRFVQADSASFADPLNPQSWNLYSYGLNNPFRYVDPTGHQPCPTIIDDTYSCVEGRAGSGLSAGDLQFFRDSLFGRPLGPISEPTSSGIVDLARGIDRGAGALPDPRFVGAFYGTSAAVGATGAVAAVAALGPAAIAEMIIGGKLSAEALRTLQILSPQTMTRVGEYLFGRHGRGLLNGRLTGDWVRLGYGWNGRADTGHKVFRLSVGSERKSFHWHWDLWRR